MINGVAFHNICEMEEREGMPGKQLQRFPQSVRTAISGWGRTSAALASGCELRFVTEASRVQIKLSSLETEGKVMIFQGNFFHSVQTLLPGIISTLDLVSREEFTEVEPRFLESNTFSFRVWRICFDGFRAVLHGIDATDYPVVLPQPGETPELKMIAYGSSITQGEGASSNYNSYVQHAAHRLGFDVLNLGLSGSCLCEPEVADFIAERNDWQIAFFELGINMRKVYTVAEFRDRVSYLLDRVITMHPYDPIFITTIYPNKSTFLKDGDNLLAVREMEFNEVLREYAARKNHPYLYVIEGSDVLTDFSSLTADLIHPSDYGHIRMGEHLAKLMQPGINTFRNLRPERRKGGDR
ncbi:lipase [Paenibacillus sp. LMG 31461]|uniref:Lipase n=1 Tax=Paenibacillus plantarum TaxID=2654975 RepID=A0ABX1XG37_9BACL|nr:SGNH/GDSL hydrolase family protein [Paenibacillus plantarum]NOU67101.1 lipase [Paenibacillus plantarum]